FSCRPFFCQILSPRPHIVRTRQKNGRQENGRQENRSFRLFLLHRTIKNQTCLDGGGIILQISQSDPTHAGKASIQFRPLRLPTLFSTSPAHWRPRRLAQPVYRSFRHPARLARSASICLARCCSTRTRRWVGQSLRHIAADHPRQPRRRELDERERAMAVASPPAPRPAFRSMKPRRLQSSLSDRRVSRPSSTQRRGQCL